MYIAHNDIYISSISVLDSLQPSAMNSFPKKVYYLYNYQQQLGDTHDFFFQSYRILDFVCGNTLIKVIHKCIMSALLPLHVWDFKSLSRLVAFLSTCFLHILKMVDQDFVCTWLPFCYLTYQHQWSFLSSSSHIWKILAIIAMPSWWIVFPMEVILYVALYTKKLNIYK